MRAAEGRGIRRKKPWSKPVVRCVSDLIGTYNGPKAPTFDEVYEGAPQNTYPNYMPQSVAQAS